jgi:MFS family permease
VIAAKEKATHARWWVVVFAITLAILSYIDRVSISQAAPNIRRDLHLSGEQMGWIFGAFGLAYAFFEIPGGWLGDVIGPRKVLLRIVLWWSAFTALTGWMFSFWPMAVVRFCFGAGEAGCFPNLTKTFTVWLSQTERVRAQGIMWTFARWGGAFTPPLVILVFQWMSWRWAFVLFGLLGVVWAFFFYRWYRDNPSEHAGVNAAELALLGGAERNAVSHGDMPWRKLFHTRSVFLLWVQYFCLSYPWYFYVTWLPTWLQEHHHLSPGRSAGFAVLPLLFGGFGALTSGFLLGPASRWMGGIGRSRRLLAMAAFTGASVLMALSAGTADALPAMLLMGLASFCNDLTMPPSWGACMDIGGKNAGAVAGSMNMMGNMAAFVAPVAGAYILKATHQNWSVYLYSMAAVYFIGALCWLGIDPATPLEEQ